ncbi:glycoside hydrolase family 24 protein [Brunnivagina elsteri]|uniref:Lysozyme n=1 Tax=Brunnivagina elsteri CCALA 953 TaxID=987040 RepID=A0A2A2TD21_9CYAN|nr:lysozyme [Calothrix elsteri]PAX51319.1 lysozyme [Calothrix elsteri CCALA 953]
MLGKIFISGLISAASSVALSYGVASVPCGLVSPGADKICLFRTLIKSIDSWKLGFIIGGIFGLVSGVDYRRIATKIQPIHLSVVSVSCLGIYCLFGSQRFGLIRTNLNHIYPGTSSKYSPRMQAFLATIRWAETGNSGTESYRKLVFNGTFNNFSTHPLQKQCAPINGRQICSTAAGAYQMLDKSWWDLQPKLKLPDFSPVSQDRMAVEYIRRNSAIKNVESGNFDKAACKVGKIWASFPCNSYNQNPKSMGELSKYYQQQLLTLGG